MAKKTTKHATKSKQAEQAGLQASVQFESRGMTVNDPWKLDLPQTIVDHYAQTSALTGIAPADLIAATIKDHFSQAQVGESRSQARGKGKG